MKTYHIDTDNFSAAIAALVLQFKTENPSIGSFDCTCLDGTTVKIKIEAKKVKGAGAHK